MKSHRIAVLILVSAVYGILSFIVDHLLPKLF
jgi:hypothetical protein